MDKAQLLEARDRDILEYKFPALSVFPACFSMMTVYEKDDVGAVPVPHSSVPCSTQVSASAGAKQVQDLKQPKFLYLRGGHVKGEDYSAFGQTGGRVALTSSMHTRFYLVPSRVHGVGGKQLAHIQSAYNNKYLTVKKCKFPFQQDENNWWNQRLVMDTADEQDEDLSKESCTLFMISDDTVQGRRQFRLFHPFFYTPTAFVVTPDVIDDKITKTEPSKSFSYPYYVDLVDVTDQVILPPYLSFKCHDSYLGVVDSGGSKHLEFASSLKKDNESVVFTSLNYPDGQVCIKSVKQGRYLLHTKGENWIKAESADCSVPEVLFKASKVGRFFALQSMTNNLFCTARNKDNNVFLQASATSITENVELTIEEPIISRAIYNIQPHRSDQAKGFDTKEINMATATAFNETSQQNTVKSSMSITTTASSKHDTTTTRKVFGEASVSAGISLWGLLDLGVSASGGFENTKEATLGISDETEKKQQIEYELTIPANRKVTLTVTAKQVKCDIPFSYTQKDRLLSGDYKIYDYDDGLYSGVNCFDLSYTTKEEPIDDPKEKVNESSKKRKGILI